MRKNSSLNYSHRRRRYAKSTSPGHFYRPPAVNRAPALIKQFQPLISAMPYFAALVGIFAGMAFAAFTIQDMAVRQIQLDGIESLKPEELNQLVALTRQTANTNILLSPVGSTISNMCRLPSVKKVTVTKKYPDTLHFAVDGRTPIAQFISPSGPWEVDTDGIVVRKSEMDSALMSVDGAGIPTLYPGQQVGLLGLSGPMEVVRQCRNVNGVRAAKIAVDQTGNICLNMNDSVTINLGRTEDLLQKLELVRRMYKMRPNISADVLSLDLRWPESPSFTPRSTSKTDIPKSTRGTAMEDKSLVSTKRSKVL